MLTIGGHGAQATQTYGEPVVTTGGPGGLAIEPTLGLEIRIHVESVIRSVTAESQSHFINLCQLKIMSLYVTVTIAHE